MSRERFALIGDPVARSASPRMHMAAYAAMGLDCVYDAIRASERDLPAVVDLLRRGKLSGVNVTIPHKRRILEHVDMVDSSARTVGAANTLVRNANGFVVAYNTDVMAIAGELRALAPDVPLTEGWMRSRALVLGTGATARSAIVALAHHIGVAEVIVRGRALEDDDRRDAFYAEIKELLVRAGALTRLKLEPWAPIITTDREILAVVQATNLGSDGGDPGEIAVEAVAWRAMFPESIALDVVYNPPVTPFLRAAAAHGVRTANGLGMLARQGALAFELWFDRPAPLSAMLAVLSA